MVTAVASDAVLGWRYWPVDLLYGRVGCGKDASGLRAEFKIADRVAGVIVDEHGTRLAWTVAVMFAPLP